MKIAILLIALIFLCGCNISSVSNDEEIADSIIKKLESDEQPLEFNEEQGEFVKGMLDKTHSGEELSEAEKRVEEVMARTSPARFLPKRDS